ncbi:MAG TPA: hypothetical protein VGD94_12370, partial [Vicinamibacterales bacterium]
MPAAVDFSATTTGSAPRGSRKYLQIFILTEDTLPKRAAAASTKATTNTKNTTKEHCPCFLVPGSNSRDGPWRVEARSPT